MKRMLVLACSAAILASCNNSSSSMAEHNDSTTTTTNATASNANDRNVENMRKIYTAIQSGDSATIRSLMADDAVDHMGPGGKEIKGAAEITHMLTDMHNHVDGLSMNVVSDAANGDYVFAMVDMKGTMKDNSFGMPAGSKLDGRSVDVVKLKDGKMVDHWGFMDPNDMMKQMPPKK